MQLKRDTDYALRLWLCISKSKSEMTISDLSKATAVPKTIALRLCQRLSEAGLLSTTGDADLDPSYFISPSAMDMTLFDLIQAVEGSCKLFAVFDQSNALYSCCKEYFIATEQECAESLKRITLRSMKEWCEI